MGATDIVKALVSPAEKLIDNITAAIGKAYLPHYTKKMADAKAYEIQQIGSSIRDNCDMPIQFNTDQTFQVDITNFEELIKRTGARVAFQEIKKQENIEAIVNNAYYLLEDSEPVYNEPVDTGWMMRFMNSVEDIDDSELQMLWSKILAGEVKSPNTYSLRTLEVLKNISKYEAELFEKISHFTINNFVFNDETICKKYEITYEDIMRLGDCGLIDAHAVVQNYPLNHGAILNNDEYALVIETSYERDVLQFKVFALTEAGKNILKILNTPIDNNYFLDVCTKIKQNNPEYSLNIHKIKSNDNDSIVILDEI